MTVMCLEISLKINELLLNCESVDVLQGCAASLSGGKKKQKNTTKFFGRSGKFDQVWM